MIAQVKGRLVNVTFSDNGKWVASFELDAPIPMSITDDLQITLDKWREKRSLNANACMWAVIDKIAEAMNTDRWSVYLKMLRDYGKVSYVLVDERALPYLKSQIREVEEMGETTVNGRKAIQVACYHGSSTLNTKEFSRLLDGVIQEAKELGIPTPEEEHLEQLIRERENGQHNN